MLIQKDQLIVENEERIIKLKLEIDISTLEMQQKKSKVKELEETLDEKKAIYKDLKKNIKYLDERAETLRT